MPPPPGPPPEPTPEYASFWARFGALVIDGLVLSPLWVMALVMFLNDFWPKVIERARQNDFDYFDQWAFWGGRAVAWLIIVTAATYAYNALMIGYKSATVGKMALGIHVRSSDGTPVGWRGALLRPVLQIAISLIPRVGIVGLLDYLWMLWDGQKQTLHDKIAGTIVVKGRG